MINHFLFKCNHPSLNINFYLFGICHSMQYDELSPYSKELLESADVIFHEGVNGVVFIDPDWKPKVSYVQPNDSNAWWLDPISDEEKRIAQRIVDTYFIKVKRKLYAPNIKDLEPWVIIELIAHFDYFARGNEIDHTLNYNRSVKNKKIVDLDQKYSLERLKNTLIEQKQIRKRNVVTFFDATWLNEINSFLETGTIEGLEHLDNSSPECPSHENTSNLVLMYNDFYKNLPDLLIGREQQWMEILHAYFKKIIENKPSSKKDVILVCGAAHVTSLVAILICEGFKVDKVLQDNENYFRVMPISKEEKGLFFTSELEKTTFNNLKSQIIRKYNKLTWQEEMVSLTNWNEWRENYRNTNKIKKGYEPGTLAIPAGPMLLSKKY